MDELDSKIIQILQEDGRASNAGIARKVGVSEGTVRRRLKRLIQEEYIQVLALPDPAKMGFASQALIGVQVEPDKVDQVADGLSDLDEITWVAITTGIPASDTSFIAAINGGGEPPLPKPAATIPSTPAWARALITIPSAPA